MTVEPDKWGVMKELFDMFSVTAPAAVDAIVSPLLTVSGFMEVNIPLFIIDQLMEPDREYRLVLVRYVDAASCTSDYRLRVAHVYGVRCAD